LEGIFFLPIVIYILLIHEIRVILVSENDSLDLYELKQALVGLNSQQTSYNELTLTVRIKLYLVNRWVENGWQVLGRCMLCETEEEATCCRIFAILARARDCIERNYIRKQIYIF
jgi:hypothetical protein